MTTQGDVDPKPVIVVGYDGSPAARAAVEYGIDRAGVNGCLIVVYAYQGSADYVGAARYRKMLDAAVHAANGLFGHLRDDCPRLAAVAWQPEIVNGAAADAISRVAEARDADEIIIGTRGNAGLRAALGSTSLGVLHRATCPVLVIPERMLAAPA